jgi:hypothetical protein
MLLGVMTPEGRIAYVHPPAVVDEEFVAQEHARGRPERRFRFAGPCIEGQCPQWTGNGCGIAPIVGQARAGEEASRRLPACSIRRTCRWFFQEGAAACSVCPLLVADMGGRGTYHAAEGGVDAGE